MPRPKSIAIKRIEVERLFGLYDYVIPPDGTKTSVDPILILFGLNGSGKTTILRLVFHLLGSEGNARHRTIVASTRFKNVRIQFTDGTEVSAERSSGTLLGPFKMTFTSPGERKQEFVYETDSEGDIVCAHGEARLLKALASIGLRLYLMSDDRRVVTSPVSNWPSTGVIRRDDVIHRRGQLQFFSEADTERVDPEQPSVTLLQDSLHRTESWIRSQAWNGRTRGEATASSIYPQIIERIAVTSPKGRPPKNASPTLLRERIAALDTRNKEFLTMGLTPAFRGASLIAAIDKTAGKQKKLIGGILGPYLDGFEAKLNALDQVKTTTKILIDTLNSFLVDKSISYHLRLGLRITSKNNETLTPQMLSSGERHLLLLFCNSVTALGQPSIFIIDEPEISLNVAWQRLLVAALLRCIGNNRVQYIFATHSLEILSQHLDRVVNLSPD